MAKLNCDKKCNLFFIAIFFCFLFSFFWSRISGLLLLIFLSRFDESAEGTGGWGCWGVGIWYFKTLAFRLPAFPVTYSSRMARVLKYQIPPPPPAPPPIAARGPAGRPERGQAGAGVGC
ncbi:hypothetical protein HGO97_018155, partial [Faecalicatena sp. AGMB00832]|nr:hypothetical protein [Faecalicatena faecalis]